MPTSFTWRPKAAGRRGSYEAAGAKAGGPAARPNVAGASKTKAPGSSTTPCPLGTIRVTVKSTDGKAIANARVSIGTGGDQRTDGAGKATFKKVPPGDYAIAVRLSGRHAKTLLAPPPCTVSLGASSSASATIEVEPTATATVRVKDHKSGRGIQGVRVVLTGREVPEEREGTTDKNGVAKIPDVRHGAYQVRGELAPEHDRRYRKPPPLPNEKVPGNPIELKAHPLGTQAIALVARSAEQGQPAAPIIGVEIVLTPGHGDPLRVQTNDEGTATFEGLATGKYTVTVDLGDRTPRYSEYQSEQIDVDAPTNQTKRIELDAIYCRLKGITIREFLGEESPGGLQESAGRTFVHTVGSGSQGSSAGIKVASGDFLQLVAPRKADVFKQPPQTPAPLPYNPPKSAFKDGALPTWLEVDLDAVAHDFGPQAEDKHPVVVAQSGGGDRVVHTVGEPKTGRFVVWGPDFPWTTRAPAPASKDRFLRGIGNRLAEVLNAVTKADAAPSYWDLIAGVCDSAAAEHEVRVPIAVFPGDQYKLTVRVPALRSWGWGVSGDYIDGEKITKSKSEGGLVGEDSSREETTSDQGTEIEETRGDEVTTTAADGSQETETKSKFAGLFEGDYEDDPVVEFTRNGERPEAAWAVDLVKGILWSSTEMTKWFGDLGNLTPKWGWWITTDVSLLKVSLAGTWGWQAAQQKNEVAWAYQLELSGTLVEVKVGIKAGLEGTVVPALVYFRAVLYLEVSGSVDAEWSWNSEDRPSKQTVSSTAGLEVGVDLVIGNANFCQAKSWVKVPYTFQWNVLPPDPKASPPAGWQVDFKHGCKDGIFLVAKYKLFYGKYQGTKKLKLKEPVPLD